MIKFSPNLVLKDVECLEAWVGRTGDLPLTHRLLHYFSAKAIPSLTGRVLLWHCTVLEIFFPVQRRKEDTSVLLDTIRTVVAHIPWIRVQTLRIQGFKMPFDLYKSILQSTNLENLRLLDTDIDNSLSSPDSFQRPILLPHLRDLTIQLVSQNPCSILRYIKTPNLTSLKLETISFKTCSWQESKSTIQTQTSSIIAFFNTSHFLLESFSWSYAFPPSEDAFLEIISHLPHLQKLNISLNDEVSMMEDQPYTFSIDEHVSARLTARNGEEYELLPRLKWIDLGQVTAEVPTMDAAISFFENRGNSDLEWARMSLTVYVDWDSGYDGAGETQAVNAALERLRALAAISDLKLDKVYVNTGTWWS